MTKLIDMSEELIIRHHSSGIYLERPNKSTNYSQNLRVRDVLKTSMNSFFLDTDSTIQCINEETITTYGYPSLKNTIGKNVYIAADKKTGDFSVKHNQKVLKTKQAVILDQDFHRIDESSFKALVFKFPWYDAQFNLIGVMGFAAVCNPYSLAESLNFLVKNHFFSAPSKDIQTMSYGRNIAGISITKREHDCIQLLMRGMSTKMIAKKLDLSPRTIEAYLENIKLKFNVHNKSALIDKIISATEGHFTP